jgi:hypothetical protein
MKTRIILFTLLMTCLASCAPAAINPTTIVPTAIQPPRRTGTPVPSTPTPLPVPEATPILIVTEIPPPFLLTPDAIQVERWKEYQSALIKVVMVETIAAGNFSIDFYDFATCEWDILERANQKVYVWAYCQLGGQSASKPVVITLNANGSIQKMEAPQRAGEEFWNAQVRKMFPADVREKFSPYRFYSAFDGRIRDMKNHLESRFASGEPPLVVLSVSPAP